MMTTNQMSEMMQSFFEDYNGKNDEINRLNDELAAVKAELAKLGIEFDRINIEFRKATEELEETRKKLAETEQELGETEQKLSETERKLKIANEIIADIRPKERPDFGIRSFEYLGKVWYFAPDLLHKKGYSNLTLKNVLGDEIFLANARKFEYRSIYDRITSGKIRKAPSGEVWCVDEVGADVILQKKKKERNPVSSDDVAKIIELYKSGMNRHDIAKETGCSYAVVVSRLGKNGYKGDKRNKFSSVYADKIIELYKGGMKRHDIAKEIGCSYKTIVKVLRKNGYGRRKAV